MVFQLHRYFIQFLTLATILLLLVVFQLPDENLHIIACDVGQGDAILTTYKNIQILTDGGANNRVLDCLGKYMNPLDKQIELVILTHPDRDHYFGLIEVVRRYKVDNLLYNKLEISSDDYKLLEKEVGSKGINTIVPTQGMKIGLGLIYLDIFHPFESFTSSQVNDYSIVYYLNFHKFKAVFTGDASPVVLDSLLFNNFLTNADYIKINHHGSRNGITEDFLKVVMPKVAVISAGKDNRYGHPHKEILDMLEEYKVKIYRTDTDGDVEVLSDGNVFWTKK